MMADWILYIPAVLLAGSGSDGSSFTSHGQLTGPLDFGRPHLHIFINIIIVINLENTTQKIKIVPIDTADVKGRSNRIEIQLDVPILRVIRQHANTKGRKRKGRNAKLMNYDEGELSY